MSFWIDDVGPDGWYKSDPELDETIRSRFMDTWLDAAAGKLDHWAFCPRGMLAFLIVTDQFPRNMFRDDPRAFFTDAIALEAASRAIARDFDQEVNEPERQFFLLPFMHSESLTMQERGVRLFMMRMSPENQNLLHARAHRKVIRDFGRFPYRNSALGRSSTSSELAYLDAGGYRHTLTALAS
nr:DUF924 family protein [Rubricella aquisinus]